MGRTKPPENCPALATDPAAFDVETLVRPATHAAYRAFVAGLLGRYRIPYEHREDFVQDVMADAAIRRHQYDPGLGTVRQWLTGFVRYKAFGYWRSQRRRPADTAGSQAEAEAEHELPSSDLTPEQTLYARRLLARLYDALSEPLREPFRLAAEGYTHDQIAAMTGLKPTTVESRLARVDKVLDQVLALLDEEERGAPDVRLCAAPWVLAGIAEAVPGGLAAGLSGGDRQWPPTSALLPASGFVPAFKLAAAGLALFAAGVAVPMAWMALRQREPAPAPRADTVVAAVESIAPASEPRTPTSLATGRAGTKPLTPDPTAAAEAEASALLLRQAHDSLQNGSPAEVVALVAEHRRRFPRLRAEERAQLLAAANPLENVDNP